MSVTIRPWTAVDHHAVVALSAELHEHERAIRPSRRPAAEMGGGYVAHLTRLLDEARGDAALLVAELDGRVVGYAFCFGGSDQLEIDPREVVLEDLVVTAAARRRSIARMLISAVRSWTAERGIRRLTISSLTGNDAALSTYRALGFTDAVVTLEMPVDGPE